MFTHPNPSMGTVPAVGGRAVARNGCEWDAWQSTEEGGWVRVGMHMMERSGEQRHRKKGEGRQQASKQASKQTNKQEGQVGRQAGQAVGCKAAQGWHMGERAVRTVSCVVEQRRAA